MDIEQPMTADEAKEEDKVIDSERESYTFSSVQCTYNAVKCPYLKLARDLMSNAFHHVTLNFDIDHTCSFTFFHGPFLMADDHTVF